MLHNNNIVCAPDCRSAVCDRDCFLAITLHKGLDEVRNSTNAFGGLFNRKGKILKNLNQISIGQSNSPSIETFTETSKTFKVPRMETITKTAEISSLPIHVVRAMVANGDVVAVRAGRKFLVNMDSLSAFLNTGVPQGAAANTTENSRRSDGETAPRIATISLK